MTLHHYIFYKELKPIFERSIYLDKIENSKFRNIMEKLRLPSHLLFIETKTFQEMKEHVHFVHLMKLKMSTILFLYVLYMIILEIHVYLFFTEEDQVCLNFYNC